MTVDDDLARELLRYLDDAMAPDRRAAFEQRMADSPGLRREVDAVRAALAMASDALREHPFGEALAEAAVRQLPEFAQEATEPALTTRVARYQRRAFELALLVVAFAAAVAGVLVVRARWPRRAVARSERAEGPVQLARHLAAGSWVRTPVGSSVALRLCDRSRMVLRGNSSVLLQQRRRLYLARGELWVEVEPDDEPFVIAAPVGWVTCRAAEMVVRSSDELTRVAVRRGSATLRGRGREIEVAEGQSAAATEGKEPTAAPMAGQEVFFGWADEFLHRPSKGAVAAEPRGRPAAPPRAALELPRKAVVERAPFAEGRSPYVLGLHALLVAAGAKVSYGRVAGLSGDPFRFFYAPAGDPYGANLYVENPLRVACGLLGYRIELAAGQPWGERWLALRRSLAAGSLVLVGARRDPRIVYPTMNWLLVYGYDLERQVVHYHALDWPGDVRRGQVCTVDTLRDAHGGYNGVSLEPDYPRLPRGGFPWAPQYRVVGKAEGAPPAPVATLTALARALAYGRGTTTGRALDGGGRPTGTAAMGLAAFELWRRHVGGGARGGAVAVEERKAIAGFGDAAGIPRFGWPLVVLKMARKDAAEFLMEASGEFEGATRAELLAAASAYRDMAEDMANLGSVYPSAAAAPAAFAGACVRASVLVEALQGKESAALRHLERALELEARQGRKPLAVPSLGGRAARPGG